MNRARRQAIRVRVEQRKAYARARDDRDALSRREETAAEALRAHNVRTVFRAGDHDEVIAVVKDRSPSILVPELVPILRIVSALPHARSIRDWEPRAKGRTGRLVSLFEHLFASVPVPSILWRGFFDAEHAVLAPLVVWLASGGSFFQYAKTRLAIPLTRKACHVALSLRTETSLLVAIRKAQALALGGSARIAHAWSASVHAARIGAAAKEAFFASFVEWLVSRAPAGDDVAVMLDYAAERFTENASFSMKGRTVESLLRDARAWHVELTKLRAVRQMYFRASGFSSITIARNVNDEKITWRVEEILSNKDLFEEGRRMGHCVYSYAGAVESGMTSIWIMTMEDGTGPTGRWAMLTVEVRNAQRAIVQARGRYNRMPTSEERAVLARFAARNNLTVTA